MWGRFGVMLLAVEVKMDCASPIGDQAVIDVPRYPASRGAKQSDISSQMSTSSPSPSGSSSKDGWSFFPTSTMHDVQFMATEPTGHRFEQDHDFIATPDAPLPSMSGYDAFDRDWLYELDIPKFTEDTNFIYPEPQELSIPAQSPVDQTTTKSTHKFSALALGSSRNTIDTLVVSDFHDPTNPAKSYSPHRSFQGQHEARECNDQEQFLHHVLSPKSRIKKLKKLGAQEKFPVISHPQEALKAHSGSHSRIPEHSALGSRRHDPGTNVLAAKRGHLSYRSEQSSKRKTPTRKSEKNMRPDKEVALSAQKMRVLGHFTKRVDQAASELEDYAQVLRHRESQPIALLTARTFRSYEELKCILNPNAKNTQNTDGQWKYIESYQRCFVPRLQFDAQTYSQQKYATKKIFSYLNYFMGRRYLWSEELDMGETIINLESKWLDHLLKSMPQAGNPTDSTFFSTYDCIKISSTIVLYQMGLLYRLSNPLEEKMKLEIREAMKKDLDALDSLWMKFPFDGKRLLNHPQSNDFWSVKVIDDIQISKLHPGSIPVELRVSKILLCQWLSKKNHTISSKIKKDKRAIPEFYQILQDFAWLDYFLMKDEIPPESPAGLKLRLNHLQDT